MTLAFANLRDSESFLDASANRLAYRGYQNQALEVLPRAHSQQFSIDVCPDQPAVSTGRH